MDQTLTSTALGIQHTLEREAFFMAAGIAVYVFDYFLTFRNEIVYVWSSPVSLVKVLFLTNRYCAFVLYIPIFLTLSGLAGTTINQCRRGLAPFSLVLTFHFFIWNCLIAIRVHALYGLRPLVKYLLVVLLCSALASSMALTAYYLSTLSRHVLVLEDLRVCTFGTTFPKNYWTVWLPSLWTEITLFAMIMWKTIKYRDVRNNGLPKLIMRDGILYFAALCAFKLVGLALYIHGNVYSIGFSVFLMLGVGSALVSRLVLNLKSHFAKSKSVSGHSSESSGTDESGRIEMQARRERERGAIDVPLDDEGPGGFETSADWHSSGTNKYPDIFAIDVPGSLSSSTMNQHPMGSSSR